MASRFHRARTRAPMEPQASDGGAAEVVALRAEVAALRATLERSREDALRLRVELAEANLAASRERAASAEEAARAAAEALQSAARPAGRGAADPGAEAGEGAVLRSLEVPEPTQADRRRLLQHLRNEAYVQLGPSRIAGVGVFAFRAIPPGVDPFSICNPHLATKEQFCVMSAHDLRQVPASVMEQVKSFFAPLTDDDDWTPQRDDRGGLLYGVLATGLNSINVSWFLNHSDDPSVVFKDAEKEGEFNSYVTKRRVEAGEELTVNYRELGSEYLALVTGDDGGA